MIKRTEGYFQGERSNPSDESELFYQSWTKSGARATFVLTHGIAEHSEAYHEAAMDFANLGYDVYAADLRGHGRSDGRRGYIDNFATFAQDLDRFIRYLKNGPLKSSKLPLVLFGHSMGGLVTLRYLVDRGEGTPAVAVVLSSPALGISMPVPALKEFAAGLLLKFLPQITLPNDIPYDKLTHVEERWKKYPNDVLRHDKISPAMYFGMVENFAKVTENASKIKIPALIVTSGDDRIVSRPAIEEFYPKVGSEKKKLIIYENSYHEILNDTEREKVIADIDQFLSPIVGGSR